MNQDQGKYGQTIIDSGNNQGRYGDNFSQEDQSGNSQNKPNSDVWICPNCETVNVDTLCQICGQKKPITKRKPKRGFIILIGLVVLFFIGLPSKLSIPSTEPREHVSQEKIYLKYGMYNIKNYNPDGTTKSSYTYSSNGDVKHFSEYDYDAQGNMIEERHYFNQGELSFKREYLPGEKTRKTTYNYDGSFWVEEFAPDGKVIGEYSYDSNGQLEYFYEYTYDNEGNKATESQYTNNGTLSVKKEYGYYGVEQAYHYTESGEIKFRIETKYEAYGEALIEKCYDSDNNLLAERPYTGGEAGEIIYYVTDSKLRMAIITAMFDL